MKIRWLLPVSIRMHSNSHHHSIFYCRYSMIFVILILSAIGFKYQYELGSVIRKAESAGRTINEVQKSVINHIRLTIRYFLICVSSLLVINWWCGYSICKSRLLKFSLYMYTLRVSMLHHCCGLGTTAVLRTCIPRYSSHFLELFLVS